MVQNVYQYECEDQTVCSEVSYSDIFPPLTVAGSDYMGVSTVLIFNATTTSHTVMIVATTDARVENEETFVLFLISADTAVIPQSVSITVSIIDMTSEYIHSHIICLSPSLFPPPLLSVVMIQFDQAYYTVSEGGSVSAGIQVMSETTLDRDVVVSVRTGGGTDAASMVVREYV